MTTSDVRQDHPASGLPTPERCSHIVDNGRGITWHCVRPVHTDTSPDAHYMVRDELAARRAETPNGA